MSFPSGVRKAGPHVFGDYLSNLVEAVFEMAFADLDLDGFLVGAIAYLVFCVLWVTVLGIVNALSGTVFRGGL